MPIAVKYSGNVHDAKFTAKRVDDVHPWLNDGAKLTAYKFDNVHEWCFFKMESCFLIWKNCAQEVWQKSRLQ